MCNFMFMQRNNHNGKVCLKFKDCKCINLETIHIYMDSQKKKKKKRDENLDLITMK